VPFHELEIVEGGKYNARRKPPSVPFHELEIVEEGNTI
jgi:hypothetical protein